MASTVAPMPTEVLAALAVVRVVLLPDKVAPAVPTVATAAHRLTVTIMAARDKALPQGLSARVALPCSLAVAVVLAAVLAVLAVVAMAVKVKRVLLEAPILAAVAAVMVARRPNLPRLAALASS